MVCPGFSQMTQLKPFIFGPCAQYSTVAQKSTFVTFVLGVRLRRTRAEQKSLSYTKIAVFHFRSNNTAEVSLSAPGTNRVRQLATHHGDKRRMKNTLDHDT